MNELLITVASILASTAGFLVYLSTHHRRNRTTDLHIRRRYMFAACSIVGITLFVLGFPLENAGISIAGVSNLLFSGTFAFLGMKPQTKHTAVSLKQSLGNGTAEHAHLSPLTSHSTSMTAKPLYPDRILQSVRECIVVTNEELQCTLWDHYCEAFFGVPQRLATGVSFPDLLYGVEPLVSENIIRQASYSSTEATLMLPAVNEMPARTLQIHVEPSQGSLYIHIRDISHLPAIMTQESDTADFSVVNHASALTYIATQDAEIHATFISPDIKEFFGNGTNGTHAARDLINRHIHPDDKQRVLDAFQKALTNRTPFSMDYRIVTDDNTVRWYHEEAMPIEGDSKSAFHGVIVNLNGKHETEETLKNTADQALETLSNGVSTGIVFLKGDIIRYANDVFSGFVQSLPLDLRGLPFTALVADSDIDSVREWFRLFHTGKAPSTKLVCEFKEEIGLIAEMELRPVEIFGQQFSLGTVRDITKEKRMEQELTRLASFPDLNPSPIIEITSDGEIAYVNQAALETFPSLPLLDREHPAMLSILDNLPFFFENDRQLFKTESTIGDRIYSQVLSHIPAAGLIRIYLNDITERHEYEEHLASAKSIAEKANRLKSEFLANMSHEIRTPLNIILGYTDLVKEVFDVQNDTQCEKYFSYIHHAGNQLTQTIDKIIDISRFHIEDFPLAPQVLPIAHMLRDCVEGFEVLALNNNLNLSLDIESENCLIYADPYAINESLLNVIGNAIKYTPEGSVSVTLGISPDNDIQIKVSDTGIGISDEFLPQLFVEFSQEEGGYGRPFEGTGLGLALTKKFIDSSGGSIVVDSVKGEGTTFTLSFPAHLGNEHNPKEPETTMNESTSQPRTVNADEPLNILVVEDDTLTQDFMKILLGKKYNKFFATSAAEANDVLNSTLVNIILMDLSIKGNEDGITLTKAIRTHPDWKSIPIIALTAHAFARDRENAIAAGCNAFFSKPFNRTELLRAIEELAAA